MTVPQFVPRRSDSNRNHSSLLFRTSLCLLILGIILVAGLWPFHAPVNNIAWLQDESGIEFGRHGAVVSTRALQIADSRGNGGWSLEFRLQPKLRNGTNTILGFYDAKHSTVPFSIQQYRDDLLLRRNVAGRQDRSRDDKLEFGNVFHPGKRIFITITSDRAGTSVYVDGVSIGASTSYLLPIEDVSGQLVVGNSPIDNDSWSGQIFSLALYMEKLTPAQVADHIKSWAQRGQPKVAEGDAQSDLYLFSERNGAVIHNLSFRNAAPDLLIPAHYFVLHSPFLKTPWREFSPRWSYWQDVGVNISGFIPLGFCFCAYFASVKELTRAALITIVLGFGVSLTIEVLQVFLPTRNSGMTDLITNTLGTAMGTFFYGVPAFRNRFLQAEALFARTVFF